MSTKSSTSKSTGKKNKKRTGKALVITIVVIVVAALLTALSPLFLPKETADKVETTVEKIVGLDSVVNKGYKKLLKFLKNFTKTVETAVTETTSSAPTLLNSGRIEGLEIPAYIENHEIVRHT
ncbi:MAG: hypothetical protein IKX15_00120, partial [Spirochaetales bacterium]|nr:hypothetical protein [Spirochaetales bacterium]